MKGTIITTYPGFGTLPLAIKLLLLTSENYSFDLRTSISTDPQADGGATVTFTIPMPKAAWAPNLWSVN